MPQILDILLHGRKVGQITDLTGDRNLFTFDEAYLADPDRPLLGLGFKGEQGGLVYTPRPRQTKLDPYFSNLLPEGKLRAYLAERDHVHPEREFQLLRLLGQDLPGGVEVRIGHGEGEPEGDLSEVEAADNSGPLKFSLAGVQMKLSALKAADGGLTVPASGAGGRWIVKFPSERFAAVPQNEYWMMTLAARMGLTVPQVELVDVGEIGGMPPGFRTDLGAALAIKRFDRTTEGGRVHMEDFAQIFRIYPQSKYDKVNFEMIGSVIWQEMGEAALSEYVARLVFSAAIGNGDMHAKNWSVLHPVGGAPQLAPAYDYVSTLTYMDGENLGLNLADSKLFEDVSHRSFEALAKRISAPVSLVRESAATAVDRFHAEWPNLREEAELPKTITAAIDAQLERVPILRLQRPVTRLDPAAALTANAPIPALARVQLLTDAFERDLPAHALRRAGAITAIFTFGLDGASSLAGTQEGLWSRHALRSRVEDARARLRSLAMDASDRAVTGKTSLRAPFRPRRGPNISLARLPLQLGPMIAASGDGDDEAHWWLLALGAGVIARSYPPTSAVGGGVSPGLLIADVIAFLAFIERFAEAFPDARGVALNMRWRGLANAPVAGAPMAARHDERSFHGPLAMSDLARRRRPAIVAAVAGPLLSAYGFKLSAGLVEELSATALAPPG